MSVFDALIGQRPVAELLQRAAWASRIGDPQLPGPVVAAADASGAANVTAATDASGATDATSAVDADPAAGLTTAPDVSTTADISSAAMAQAWLVTGPPGSGRSVAALAFAAAVQCTGAVPGCGYCHACTTTLGGTHPDVIRMDPRSVTISVEETRSLVASSYTFPSVGRRRIIIIEDADRMLERTTNVLLKAIEEPPRDTVWILITASPEDMLPTIRSRCRHVALQVPSVEAVAQLLAGELGVRVPYYGTRRLRQNARRCCGKLSIWVEHQMRCSPLSTSSSTTRPAWVRRRNPQVLAPRRKKGRRRKLNPIPSLRNSGRVLGWGRGIAVRRRNVPRSALLRNSEKSGRCGRIVTIWTGPCSMCWRSIVMC